MPEKAVYSLTGAGEIEFDRLMHEIASKPVHFFLDFNAVIVNLESLSPDNQNSCLSDIECNVKTLKTYIEENLQLKEHLPEIPETGIAVLKQQLVLAEAIEAWIAQLKKL